MPGLRGCVLIIVVATALPQCLAATTDPVADRTSDWSRQLLARDLPSAPSFQFAAEARAQAPSEPALPPLPLDEESLNDRPLVPLPTPMMSGLVGLGGMAAYALAKNARRLLT